MRRVVMTLIITAWALAACGSTTAAQPATPPVTGANQAGSGPVLPADIRRVVCSSLSDVGDTHPWSMQYVLTTERHATRVLDTAGGDHNTHEWAVILRGHFRFGSVGIGGGPVTGTVLTNTYDAKTHQHRDTGLENRYFDPHPLGPVGTFAC